MTMMRAVIGRLEQQCLTLQKIGHRVACRRFLVSRAMTKLIGVASEHAKTGDAEECRRRHEARVEQCDEKQHANHDQHVEIAAHVGKATRCNVLRKAMVPVKLEHRLGDDRVREEVRVVEIHVQNTRIHVDPHVHDRERSQHK